MENQWRTSGATVEQYSGESVENQWRKWSSGEKVEKSREKVGKLWKRVNKVGT